MKSQKLGRETFPIDGVMITSRKISQFALRRCRGKHCARCLVAKFKLSGNVSLTARLGIIQGKKELNFGIFVDLDCSYFLLIKSK
jgi:hypothetical protein